MMVLWLYTVTVVVLTYGYIMSWQTLSMKYNRIKSNAHNVLLHFLLGLPH